MIDLNILTVIEVKRSLLNDRPLQNCLVCPPHSQPAGELSGRNFAKKKKNHPVYDYRNAVIADRLGVDILCVSDTGGMVLFGHKSTVTVTFEEVMFMAMAVDRGLAGTSR